MIIDKAVIRAAGVAAPLAVALAPVPLFATDLSVGSDRDAPQLAQLTDRERRLEEQRRRQAQAQAQRQRREQEQSERNPNLLDKIEQQSSQQEQQRENAAAADPRFDPEVGYSPEGLKDLVTGTSLERLSPEQLALFVAAFRDRLASRLDRSPGEQSTEDSDLTEDELLKGIIELAEREQADGNEQDDGWAQFASEFPLVASGQVSPTPPLESLSGDLTASYDGRFAGAFGDGTAVGGSMHMTVHFDDRTLAGHMLFDGANGIAGIEGGWADGVNTVTGDIQGQGVFGDYIEGGIDGAFYGPKGEELGGTWSAEIFTNGQREHSLGGRFAAGQQP
ncbi:MAG TPA: transferrin-binding protein-like solute binding protein [Alphaproteobacteria bacterium]|nr:transferrin-binding protein-like solute binding protein [Alphaproteobacteria bacterium]